MIRFCPVTERFGVRGKYRIARERISPGTGTATDMRISRRDFITHTAIIAGGLTAGLPAGRAPATDSADGELLRVVFATDSHLMVDNLLRSGDGLMAALSAIESLSPKADFILFGGDLTHESPQLDFPAAERLIDRFLKIWKDHTDLPTFYTFGNHDLVGTKNSTVNRDDPRFGKGLYRMRLELERNFYAFRKGGWRFIVLDDVLAGPDGSYVGEFVEEQLSFLRSELQTDSQTPTVLCGHIPSVSVLPNLGICGEAKNAGASIQTPASLLAHNASDLHKILNETKANVKLVLAGHLHHLEQIQVDGVAFLNSGAICGNWWKGAQVGCPEGFTVLDLSRSGHFAAEYRPYGWKAIT
jgi:3',5'-cyclic-AMP phosphodiesterase